LTKQLPAPEPTPARDPSFIPFLRSLGLEMIVYAPLLVIYLLVVLRFFKDPLFELAQTNLVIYAVVGLAAIVAQSVLLEILTTWLLRRFGVRL
jgi:hypothetical protein